MKTTKQFIEEANKIHNGKYSYEKVVYTGCKNKITIICNIHGDFEQTPDKHLSGNGCQTCSITYRANIRRNTLEEFIEQANRIHNEQYSYSNVKYININTKITITCKVHGDFEQVPNSHLKGNGCRYCGINRITSKLRNTTEDFIKQANKVHNNLYSYNKVVYINNKTKVTITCRIHGDFEQTPANHINGKHCYRCSSISRCNNIRFTREEFITKARTVHKELYSYSKVNYINANSKVTISCKIHGDFEQTPNNHLRGNNCDKCVNNIKNIEFIEKANNVHNEQYSYSNVKYIDTNSKVTITCKIHGDFEQLPNNHLSGKGCSKCYKIGYSKKAISWLNYIAKTQQISIQHAKNGGEFLIPGTKFKADGYCKENNTIYEFHGDFWHGNPDRFSEKDYNKVNKCSYGELYQDTLKREQQIRDLGYNLVTIWESDWDKQEKLLDT